MKCNSVSLINDLIATTENNIGYAKQFLELPKEAVSKKRSDGGWSILECLEHLNLYGDFYHPTFEKIVLNADDVANEVYKSGWLGNYFANGMLPKEGEKLNSMKTFKDKDPSHSSTPISTIDRFIKQQQHLLQVLKIAKTKDITRLRTPITISKWITIRLGDGFRFVINHNVRHIEQALQHLH